MVATCISSPRGGNSPSGETTLMLSSAANASEKAKHRQQTEMLDMWITLHGDNLYPCREEKERIAKDMSMSYLQVNRWFANRRRKQTKRRKGEAVSPRPTTTMASSFSGDNTAAAWTATGMDMDMIVCQSN
ncbi:unnamed protein product [Toxocara canis]|uniref:Homeobox domain-containing protein n=1 Tax=Toxocara canis TaxID=6265 RepID=A0A183UZG7_TOXCA|nr:unnamed protein product [Toxocara canis]